MNDISGCNVLNDYSFGESSIFIQINLERKIKFIMNKCYNEKDFKGEKIKLRT